MNEGEPDKRAQMEQLARLAAELVRRVTTLDKQAGDQILSLAVETRNTRRLMWALVVSLVLDAALTVTLTVGMFNLHQTNKEVDKIARELQASESVQRGEALCPLYQLFLESLQRAEEEGTVENRDRHDHNMAVIRRGYETMQCER